LVYGSAEISLSKKIQFSHLGSNLSSDIFLVHRTVTILQRLYGNDDMGFLKMNWSRVLRAITSNKKTGTK